MQAYINQFIPSVKKYSTKAIVIKFSGSDIKYYFEDKSLHYFDKEQIVDLKKVISEMESVAPYVNAVIFSGGEPLLQADALQELSAIAKKLKLAVYLETYGTKPLVLKSLIEKKVFDVVVLNLVSPLNESFFSKVTSSETFFKSSLQYIRDISESINILAASDIKVIFKTPVPADVFSEDNILDIASYISIIPGAVYILEPILLQKVSKILLYSFKSAIKKKYPLLTVKVIL